MASNHRSNLPVRIFMCIAHSFSFLGDYLTSFAVCNSWGRLVSEFNKLCLPPIRFPVFEHVVATGAIFSDCDNKKCSHVVEKQDDDFVDWSNLPPEILILIVQKLSLLRDYIRFTTVCKSWRDSVSTFKKPCLSLTGIPFLLLAEDVAPGTMLEYDPSQDYDVDEEEEEEEEEEDSGDDDDDEEEYRYDDNEHEYDHSKLSVSSSRGLYSILTGKTYYLDLPEAAGRLILGTNKGWLVTLGIDLKINLLHPVLNHQISLPPMLTFPRQITYDETYMPEEAFDIFMYKVAISSNILNKDTAYGLYHHYASPLPSVMAIYGECSFLGFARVGDKVWTDVNVPSRSFDDIVYHKGNFYAVDCHGHVFVCGINDDKGDDIRGTQIASLKSNDFDKKYLVEPISGSGLLLLVRYCKDTRFKYRTTGFSVWRLCLNYSDSLEDISCSLKEEGDLGNEAIFVGRASSTAISSSEIIKPNCIYFTDDNHADYYHKGGGHDMGIFSIKNHTIEPHFQGKSYHPISPPLWYI